MEWEAEGKGKRVHRDGRFHRTRKSETMGSTMKHDIKQQSKLLLLRLFILLRSHALERDAVENGQLVGKNLREKQQRECTLFIKRCC